MKLEQLTITRFIAAIAIVIYHYGNSIFPFNHDSIHFLFLQANNGVSYFFILSGFVMVIAYGSKSKINYFEYIKRRFARIYPVYILAILIFLIYLIYVGIPFSYKELFYNITLIQSWIAGYALSFNTPGWSLAVEMFFYFSFPILFNYVYKNYSPKQLLTPVLMIFIVSQLLMHILLYTSFYEGYPSKSHDLIFFFPPMHLNEFLIGNLAGLFFIKGIKVRNYDIAIIILIIFTIVILKFNAGIFFHNGMLAFLFVPIIMLISSNNGLISKISSHKSLVFLGEISYGIYILQKPTYIWVNHFMEYLNIHSTTLIFYSFVLILVIFSSVSYLFFEKPLRKKINQIKLSYFNFK